MTSYLGIFAIAIGGWEILNGILHDIFVLSSEHGKKYDRNLLRLLMDGHILITCGAMQMISFLGFSHNEIWASYVAGAASLSLLIYCAMIFPFLKSVFTIIINFTLLVMIVLGMFNQ